RIPIELVFESRERKRYQVDSATGDRSGREHMDLFQIEPAAGVVDPLADYFWGGIVGGGPRGLPVLDGAPVPIRLDLNEWARFDRPGTYRVSVMSVRAADLSRPNSMGIPGARCDVSSAGVTLVVDPREPRADALRRAALLR